MFESTELLKTLLILAGIGQLILVTVSPAIPFVLNWKSELAPLTQLTRRLFWVYAAYILGTNFCFGLLSTFAPLRLMDQTFLAGIVSAYIALYWGARLAIQFTCFRSEKPPGRFFKVAEWALASLFTLLTVVYGIAAGFNFMELGS